ncbi:PP2C family protein-serine/threonine phosphatase [Geodermatophilus sp. SYSU D00815]
MHAITTGADEDSRELHRLRALEDLDVLTAGPEERFDRITRLARQLFGVATAAVTLVDRDTQHVKSQHGEEIDDVPRSEAFCGRTIQDSRILVVEDARADERFAANSLVTGEPHIRFYAGRPLAAPGGHRVGALCLVDDHPRSFGPAELALLDELGAWVEHELTRSQEMQQAGAVQRALLPRRRPDVDGYDVLGACLPARAVGGDFVDWYTAPDGDLVLTLGDVMGKGLSAGIIMATVRAAMRAAGRLVAPAAAVAEAAEALHEDLERTQSMVTLCHARLSPGEHVLRYADAGHGLMLLVRADGTVVNPPAGGLPLGVLPGERWVEDDVRLARGDTVVAFSDGVLDLYDGTLAARDELAALVRESACAADAVNRVVRRARRLDPLPDDVALVAVRRLP